MKFPKDIALNNLQSNKGGDLQQEIAESKLSVQQFQLSEYFNEEFFETKKMIYVGAPR